MATALNFSVTLAYLIGSSLLFRLIAARPGPGPSLLYQM